MPTILHADPVMRVTLPLGATVTGETIRREYDSVATVCRAGRTGGISGGTLGLFRGGQTLEAATFQGVGRGGEERCARGAVVYGGDGRRVRGAVTVHC